MEKLIQLLTEARELYREMETAGRLLGETPATEWSQETLQHFQQRRQELFTALEKVNLAIQQQFSATDNVPPEVQVLVREQLQLIELIQESDRKLLKRGQELQQQAPQSSMLYLLEARLYLLTGLALDYQRYLLNGYDREAAQEWYRRALPVSRKAIEANKSYGLSYLYEAESLARLNRCEEVQKKIAKLHKAGYKSSSTHALMAFCAISTGDESLVTEQIAQAIDAANREEAAGWANKYKKHLKIRKEWRERQNAARFSGQLGMVLDDSKNDVPFSIERLMLTQGKCLY